MLTLILIAASTLTLIALTMGGFGLAQQNRDKIVNGIIVLVVALVLWVGFFGFKPAQAHDQHGDANWIANGAYRSPIDGSHCCGAHDCVMVEADYVREVTAGYWLNGPVVYRGGSQKGDTPQVLNEVVPHKEVQRSKDGNYWRCKKPDGSRRCFFAPPGTT